MCAALKLVQRPNHLKAKHRQLSSSNYVDE